MLRKSILNGRRKRKREKVLKIQEQEREGAKDPPDNLLPL